MSTFSLFSVVFAYSFSTLKPSSSWIVMARFSAKTSSTDTCPRRYTRQRRRGPKRPSSASPHHKYFDKARPIRTVTLKRSRLTFVYAGNVSAHSALLFSKRRLKPLSSLVLMSATPTSKSCSDRAVKLRRLISVAALVLGQCLGVLVTTLSMRRSYSPAWKRQQEL